MKAQRDRQARDERERNGPDCDGLMRTRPDRIQPEQHGGDRLRMGREAGVDPEAILDFSVNVRPEGPPEFLTAALWRAMSDLAVYPSPRAEEVAEAAARRHGFPLPALPGGPDAPAAFVFGNGSNELIHALMRALMRAPRPEGRSRLIIAEPAFSEYAAAARAAGLEVCSVPGDALFRPDWDALTTAPAGSAVIFANPGNPSGVFTPPALCAAALDRRPDLVWIVDEAFIDYAGDGWIVRPDDPDLVSLLPLVPARPNWVVLRSLTKFYAVPGLRLGYAALGAEWARRLAAELPVWNVNALALAAGLAVFADRSDFVADFAAKTRRVNRERRADLAARLASLPVRVYPSEASYLLFRWPDAPDLTARLAARLLAEYGIALRDCSNYVGLEDGSWFRAAVRLPEDHERLIRALTAVADASASPSASQPASPSANLQGRPLVRSGAPRPALMLQGTSSDAGKSVLAAAFCRILRQDGYDVAPFKAQNMSLNSGVTAAGEEMGRAQIVQALACGIDPDARMNPILLKPQSETGSQIILLGEAVAALNARDYMGAKHAFWPHVARAYDELAAEHEVMVLEGAGSPAEINLKDGDLVNMRMAAHARAAVLLAGDIDRGGVYASFLGTWMTFSPAEQRLVAGFLVNRFRGDASLLDPAHAFLYNRTGRPVLGVIPYLRDIGLPDEDMAGFERRLADGAREAGAPSAQGSNPESDRGPGRPLDIAVIMPRHVSNYTDFLPLDREPDVRLRAVRHVRDWGDPDLIILPGSKSVAADLADLRANGLADRILEHARRDGWIFGVCGGLQILGQRLLDPSGVESAEAAVQGLGLLALETTLAPRKTLRRVDRVETPLGVPSAGYEIHHGRTTRAADVRPLFRRACGEYGREDADQGVCGYGRGRRWSTYLHGIFDDDAFRRAFLDHVRRDLGLDPVGRVVTVYNVDQALDRLAAVVRERVDLQRIYRSMGL